jgi:hypothetical protein
MGRFHEKPTSIIRRKDNLQGRLLPLFGTTGRRHMHHGGGRLSLQIELGYIYILFVGFGRVLFGVILEKETKHVRAPVRLDKPGHIRAQELGFVGHFVLISNH